MASQWAGPLAWPWRTCSGLGVRGLAQAPPASSAHPGPPHLPVAGAGEGARLGCPCATRPRMPLAPSSLGVLSGTDLLLLFSARRGRARLCTGRLVALPKSPCPWTQRSWSHMARDRGWDGDLHWHSRAPGSLSSGPSLDAALSRQLILRGDVQVLRTSDLGLPGGPGPCAAFSSAVPSAARDAMEGQSRHTRLPPGPQLRGSAPRCRWRCSVILLRWAEILCLSVDSILQRFSPFLSVEEGLVISFFFIF